MALPDTMSIDLREAAVASVLAGAVVIVLGYASGLGLHTPLVAAAGPAPTAPVTVPEPIAVPATATVVPGTVFVPVVTRVEVPVPVHTYPHTTPTATPTPTEPPAETCEPGLLGSLLSPVDSLLGGITAPVTCTVDGLLGSGCCGSTATGLLNKGAAR